LGAATTFARGEDVKPPADAPKPEQKDGQRPGGPEGRGGGGDRPRMEPGRILDRVQETLKDLNLSDDQKTKIKTIIDKARTDLQAAMKDQNQAPEDRRQKVREALAPVREKINEVLDETQRDKLREKMQREGFRGPGERERGGDGADKPKGDRPERPEGAGRPGRPGGPDGAGGPPRRGDGPGPGMGRLRENLDKLGLSDDQRKKVDSLLSETEKKVREAMENSKKQLDEILTDEQKQKLKEMMAPQRGGRGERGEGRGEGPRRPGGPGGDGGNGDEKRPPKE
jgi:Spy/CpxP family protein refolding chaperone